MGGTGNQGAGQLSYNSAIDFNADCRNVHGVGSNAFIYFERVFYWKRKTHWICKNSKSRQFWTDKLCILI